MRTVKMSDNEGGAHGREVAAGQSERVATTIKAAHARLSLWRMMFAQAYPRETRITLPSLLVKLAIPRPQSRFSRASR